MNRPPSSNEKDNDTYFLEFIRLRRNDVFKFILKKVKYRQMSLVLNIKYYNWGIPSEDESQHNYLLLVRVIVYLTVS